MSYFDEVYVKRLNRLGNTRQERAQSMKENEFEQLFLKRSQYVAKIYQKNDSPVNVICSLQPNKFNEKQYVANVLVSNSEERFSTGDLLHIFQKIDDVEYDKIWIIVFKEDNIGKGYQNYKAICLEDEIGICDEYGTTKIIIPVKFINASETKVEDLFIDNAKTKGYREPDREIKILTQTNNDYLKKDTYFEFNEKGFKITGIDDISIHGVSYLSIEERLKKEPEPISSKDIVIDDSNFFLNNR